MSWMVESIGPDSHSLNRLQEVAGSLCEPTEERLSQRREKGGPEGPPFYLSIYVRPGSVRGRGSGEDVGRVGAGWTSIERALGSARVVLAVRHDEDRDEAPRSAALAA